MVIDQIHYSIYGKGRRSLKYYLGRMSIVVILLTVAAQSSGYAEQGITAQQRVFLFSGAAIGSGQELLANEF